MRRTGLIRLLPVGLALMLALSSAVAGTKDLRIDGKPPAEFVASQTGKSWAVVIGIDQYDHAPRLHYAVADAKAMARVLEQQGFQVVTLYDREATKDAIEGELGDRLVDRVGEHDRVLIFYSGHGETKTVKGGRTQGYLLPVGGRQEELARTAISMGRIRELADALPSKHVLFLVDVCYGGVAGTQFRAMPSYTEEYLKAITRERGRQLITAGGPEQRALEGPEWGHSVFTYYLLEGLQKGLADLNSDGIIPASELYAYLDSRVFAAAQMRGHLQKPEMWSLAAEKGEFVFLASAATSGPPSTPLVGGASAEEMAAMKKRLEEMERRLAEQARAAQPSAPTEEARTRPYEAPQGLPKEIVGKDGAPMVLIPAGDFLMGSGEGQAHEKPVHRVSLDAFYLDRYEVTNKLFQKFVQETGYQTTAERGGSAYAYVSERDSFSDSWRLKEVSGANWRKPDGEQTVLMSNRGDHPVVSVSWYDAEAYCRWAGRRLPTEAEFEYANRGGTRTRFWWGDGHPGSRLVANIADETGKRQFSDWTIVTGYDDGYVRTAPVGSFAPNPFGLYDTIGNVWEWTADWYGKEYYQHSPQHNPTGPLSGEHRVIRGGSWYLAPAGISSAARSWFWPKLQTDHIGFRCARNTERGAQQPQEEIQVVKAPAYETPRQLGGEIRGEDSAPMLLVPGGEFLYGGNNLHLTISPFYMDKYEVSVKLYAAFLKATGRAQPPNWSDQIADRPVVNVSWQDADSYCRHYRKRLPTEQEWEKAARGTDGRAYPWGDEEPTSQHGLFKAHWEGYMTLAPVESYDHGKSPYGFYNMFGNVWEWTDSDYDNSGEFKVIKGGSWEDIFPVMLQASLRGRRAPEGRDAYQGFRCAQDAQ